MQQHRRHRNHRMPDEAKTLHYIALHHMTSLRNFIGCHQNDLFLLWASLIIPLNSKFAIFLRKVFKMCTCPIVT